MFTGRVFTNGSFPAKYRTSLRHSPFGIKYLRGVVGMRNYCLRPEFFNATSSIGLIGPPGCGKTSVGKLLSSSLGYKHYDIDDDHLEKKILPGTPYATVSEVLDTLGDEKFLQFEEESCFNHIDVLNDNEYHNMVISLTGSNPLSTKFIDKLKLNCTLIYLDCKLSDIVDRMSKMKVNRIVGMKDSGDLYSILQYRESFYQACYDLKINISSDDTLDDINDKILNLLDRIKNGNPRQIFVSTRSKDNEDELSSIILNGLSTQDGGLYIPYNFLQILHKYKQTDFPFCKNYNDLCLKVLETFPMDKHLNSQKLFKFIDESYNSNNWDNCVNNDNDNIMPLNKIDKNLYILELYNGPTASFKDFALQLFPKLFDNAFKNVYSSGKKALFLVATSGDTGSAVLDGFSKLADNDDDDHVVVILYPLNGISKIQENQMKYYCNKYKNKFSMIGIKNGDFDYCQQLIKTLFQNDNIFGDEYLLSSANSINWARLLPQITFAFNAYFQLLNEHNGKNVKEFDICIPSGNFGHAFGVIIAQKMGIPIRNIIIASNENCSLYDFIQKQQQTLDNRNRSLVQTISPSIDILFPSNLERYLYLLLNENSNNVNQLMNEYKSNRQFTIDSSVIDKFPLLCGKSNENETYSTINEIYKKYNIIIDPHTAVGIKVGNEYFNKNENVPMIISSTAHWSKFPQTILNALENGGNTNGESDDYKKIFDILNNKYPSKKTPIHKSIEKLIDFDIDNTKDHPSISCCQPNQTEIVEKIQTFLQYSKQASHHKKKNVD